MAAYHCIDGIRINGSVLHSNDIRRMAAGMILKEDRVAANRIELAEDPICRCHAGIMSRQSRLEILHSLHLRDYAVGVDEVYDIRDGLIIAHRRKIHIAPENHWCERQAFDHYSVVDERFKHTGKHLDQVVIAINHQNFTEWCQIRVFPCRARNVVLSFLGICIQQSILE